LGLLRATPPDLLIMDYIMAGVSADEFIASARAGGFLQPIMLCTGMEGDLGLPVDSVVRKPFDPDELCRQVARLLAG
jgi:CheY-like chemotaxis protein